MGFFFFLLCCSRESTKQRDPETRRMGGQSAEVESMELEAGSSGQRARDLT